MLTCDSYRTTLVLVTARPTPDWPTERGRIFALALLLRPCSVPSLRRVLQPTALMR